MSKFLTPPVWYDKNGNLNDMLTGEASENGVAVGSGANATMGGVAVGYNAVADDEGVAIGHNANTRGGIAIGGDATEGGVAIQGTVTGTATGAGVAIQGTATGNSVAIGGTAAEGGIAIGATATGNGIAIGGAAAANKVQLGSTSVAYDLTVGNGSGTLKIGSIAGAPKIESIKFKQMQIQSYNVNIPQSGVYLCCTTHKQNPQAVESTTDVAICFIYDRSDTNLSVSMLTSASGSCYYDKTDKKIKPGTNYTIKYCFQIISF